MVWFPVLQAGGVERAARRAASRVSDPRAEHFFDPDARLAKLYAGIIQLPRGLPAWDVYFAFGPAARWPDTNRSGAREVGKPPAPTYWMHQLGRAAPSELRLDGDQLARVVSGLLASIEKDPPKAVILGELPAPQSNQPPWPHPRLKETDSAVQ